MTIQIIGHKKNNDTKKALRFFKERGVPFQFLDIAEKPLSKGELEHITRHIPADELIDTTVPEYAKRGYAYMEFDPFIELMAHPLLLKIPIVRTKKDAAVGHRPELWREWIEKE